MARSGDLPQQDLASHGKGVLGGCFFSGSCELFFFQAVGDEVKGIYPLAYEDMSTEAMFCDFLVLSHQSGGQCPFFFGIYCCSSFFGMRSSLLGHHLSSMC